MSAPYLSHSDPRPVLKLEESYFSFSRCGANATFFSLSATSQSSFFILSSLAMTVSHLTGWTLLFSRVNFVKDKNPMSV